LLLRASGASSGETVDVRAVTDSTHAVSSGVPHAAVLIAFAEAATGTNDAALDAARSAVLREMGAEQLIDAAAVISNFERMVRVADATGTPLDAPLLVISQTLRRDLDLDRFTAAAATPPPWLVWRLAGRVVEPVAMGLLRLWARLGRQ
jgi:hypothetical protein